MTIQTIEFQGEIYPLFQAEGFASQYAFPFASKVCKGIGYDIGCMKKEWSFPGSIPIDKLFEDGWDALHLPQKGVDYIFSSHMLEHTENWIETLDYWTSVLKIRGILFLYLPHYDQKYWRPWHNRKHKHALNSQMIRDYLTDNHYTNIFYSERDLNYSFMIFGEKS